MPYIILHHKSRQKCTLIRILRSADLIAVVVLKWPWKQPTLPRNKTKSPKFSDIQIFFPQGSDGKAVLKFCVVSSFWASELSYRWLLVAQVFLFTYMYMYVHHLTCIYSVHVHVYTWYIQCCALSGEKMDFCTLWVFSWSYSMLFTHNTYQHDPQLLLINLITMVTYHMTAMWWKWWKEWHDFQKRLGTGFSQYWELGSEILAALSYLMVICLDSIKVSRTSTLSAQQGRMMFLEVLWA